MNLLACTRQRISSVLEQVKSLAESEFPHPHSRDVLAIIENELAEKAVQLDVLDEKSDTVLVKQQCGLALRALFRFLPRLGLILRSTNVRNAFELFGPLLRIAAEMLEPGVKPKDRTTKLVLSSEWDYSPFTYPLAADLPGVVFIGLPAPESANPLLIPLAGHELGHNVWYKNKLDGFVRPTAKALVVKFIGDNWAEYAAVFPYVASPKILTTDMFAQETWTPALQLVLRQAEETFADFLGLRLFGVAYYREQYSFDTFYIAA